MLMFVILAALVLMICLNVPIAVALAGPGCPREFGASPGSVRQGGR